MRARDSFERFWSDDGKMLLAPDLLLHVGPMLERAKEQYGPVVWRGGWELGAIAFHGQDPSVRRFPEGELVAIVLPDLGVDNDLVALSFLAHELVHCMYLPSERGASMIEEGAAVRFSLIEAASLDPEFGETLREHQTSAPWTEHYGLALACVEALLELNPDAIRTLRTEDPDWSAITPERIRAVAPGIPDEMPELLCEVREMRPDWERMAALAEQEARA